ncbi:DUF6879 family protein [Nocardia africana]
MSRSAFHVEVRDAYAVPSESEPLRRFLNGEPPPESSDESWNEWDDLVRDVASRGVIVSRIRIVTVPHSDYHRWLLTQTADNVAAGEDIRYLPRHLVDEDSIPADDFWLLDEKIVAFNLVDARGRPAGAAVTTDPGIALRCQRLKDHLWPLATPFAEYVGSESARR